MARIFMDGFETGDLSLWTTNYNADAYSAVIYSGMSGSYTLRLSASTGTVEKNLPSTKTELYVAFKYYSNLGSPAVCSFRDSTNICTCSLTKNSTSKLLEFRRGEGDQTVISTGSKTIHSQITCLIEIYYKPLNSGGVFTLKVDGVQDINYSGDTTAGAEDIGRFRLGTSGGDESASYNYYDDVVLDDANWIGNTKLGIIVPDGTGTTNNWTASTGNAWDCLNEKPPSDTDYVYSNTTNQIATYAMTTIANMNTVKSIQLQGRAAYEGSPTPTKIQLGVRASGTDYFATDISTGIGFVMNSKILELNPADSAAWEQADIDALEIGVKAIA